MVGKKNTQAIYWKNRTVSQDKDAQSLKFNFSEKLLVFPVVGKMSNVKTGKFEFIPFSLEN